MAKHQITFVLVMVLQIIDFSIAQKLENLCIPLNECPVAVKYLQKRHNDPVTIAIFRSAHCGTIRQSKVYCNRIPDFEDLPEGCVSISECPEAIQLKNAREDPDAVDLLNSAACGYSGRKDMIICNSLTPKMKAVNPTKTNLLPTKTECGLQAPTSKITFGQRADFEDFPWLALLGYKDRSDKIVYRCHGTLISKRYVVTAAHCLKYSSADRQKIGSLEKIVLGEYDTSKTEDCYSGYCTDPLQEFSPESIHIHPNFESAQGVSDIALVRLNKNANYSDFVKPICIPMEYIPLKPHDSLLIGGWGKTEKKKTSDIKLKAQISYLTNEECSQFNIDSTQICAGSTTGADTCKGDSGGPLMVTKQCEDRETRSILIGIVSFGGKCGSGSAIYTNVTTFVKWILDTVHE